jgi:hypothetical protein
LKFVSAFAIGLVALSGYSARAEEKPDSDEAPETISAEAHPIASFDRVEPGKTHFGKLKWLGGLVLTSPSSHFGGGPVSQSMPKANASSPSPTPGAG